MRLELSGPRPFPVNLVNPVNPEGIKVNSRGRAALRDAHGHSWFQHPDPVRVKLGGAPCDPYRVGMLGRFIPGASRNACPRLLT